jgi:hypothetical protein
MPSSVHLRDGMNRLNGAAPPERGGTGGHG